MDGSEPLLQFFEYDHLPEHLRTILPLTARILGHIHHRSVRRMTVQGMGLRDE